MTLSEGAGISSHRIPVGDGTRGAPSNMRKNSACRLCMSEYISFCTGWNVPCAGTWVYLAVPTQQNFAGHDRPISAARRKLASSDRSRVSCNHSQHDTAKTWQHDVETCGGVAAGAFSLRVAFCRTCILVVVQQSGPLIHLCSVEVCCVCCQVAAALQAVIADDLVSASSGAVGECTAVASLRGVVTRVTSSPSQAQGQQGDLQETRSVCVHDNVSNRL